MKKTQKIFTIIIFAFLVFCLKNNSYAGSQKLTSLDYQVILNEDGSADVVETWNIIVSHTNTLFKDFDLDSSKYSSISNVKVKNLKTDEEFLEISEEMYHVPKGCYYGLPISGNKFEIAWGVGLDDETSTEQYQISYTVNDAIAIYNDCEEFYWQFIGTDNGISAANITGTIKLPKKVNNIENLRIWAHGPLEGEITKESNDTAIFNLRHLDPKTMLEVRIVTEEKMFYSGRMYNQNKINSILKEETKWANQANWERNKIKLIIAAIVIVEILILIYFGKKIKKYYKEYKELPENHDIPGIGKYFRDIPSEKNVTPACAAYLYYSKNNNFDGIKTNMSKVFSATLLQLCLKKYLEFESQGKEIRIKILDREQNQELKPSEEKVYNFINKLSNKDTKTVTMDEIKNYAKKNYDEFDSFINDIKKSGRKENINLRNYNERNEKKSKSYSSKAGVYIFAIVFVGMFLNVFGLILLPIYIEWAISAIILFKSSKKVRILTENGETERLEWKGLKNYMEDFSLLKERDIPELVLWEKYLVYATAFGIADKVIKQLKVVYPNIDEINDSTYTYMHLMNHNDFINNFNKSVDKAYSSYRNAYNAAHSSSSSGSGGGGGFSGGGGGRRRRWPEWEADSMKIGIDIGGSHIGIGLINGSEIVLSKEKNFNREDRKDIELTIINSIKNMINELLEESNLKIEDIELIGIAAPGTISDGVIVKAGNLNITNFDIVSELKKIYSNEIQIRNDAKCAALAEKAYGEMKDYDDCVFINIGTGIGGAAFLGGRLLEPKRYSGFEFGHMILNKGGRLCSCGKQGCFEVYSSIKALKMKVTETLDVDNDISGQYLRENLLIKDHPGVKEDIDVFLEYMKTGIGNLIDIFEPEIVVLGGSFAYYEGNPIYDMLIEKLKNNATFNNDLPIIKLAKLKNNAGIIGAVIK